MFTYKKSSCNSSFTAVPTCCEPAALLSAGLCLQESSVSLFVLLAQSCSLGFLPATQANIPAVVQGAPRYLPACAFLCFHLLAVCIPQKIFLSTFPQQTFLGWFLDSQERAQSGTFLLPRTKLWAAGLALSLSFPRQGWLHFTWQLKRVSGDSPEQCFPRFQPHRTVRARHTAPEESGSGGNIPARPPPGMGHQSQSQPGLPGVAKGTAASH